MSEYPKKTGEIREENGQFKKGISGNPDGRPKGSVSVVDAIRRRLKEVPQGKQKEYCEFLVDALFSKAIGSKDVSAIREIIDRVDGKPVNKTELSGAIGINQELTPKDEKLVDAVIEQLKKEEDMD